MAQYFIDESESTCDLKIQEAYRLLLNLEQVANELSKSRCTEDACNIPNQLARLATKVVTAIETALRLVEAPSRNGRLSLVAVKQAIRSARATYIVDATVESLMTYCHHGLSPDVQEFEYLRVLRLALILMRLASALSKMPIGIPSGSVNAWMGLLFDDKLANSAANTREFIADEFLEWLPEPTQVLLQWAFDHQVWSHLGLHLRAELQFARHPAHVVRILVMLWAIESHLIPACSPNWNISGDSESGARGQSPAGIMN